jgi:hypothetical protein
MQVTIEKLVGLDMAIFYVGTSLATLRSENASQFKTDNSFKMFASYPDRMFLQVFADDTKKTSQFKISYNYIDNDPSSELQSLYKAGEFTKRHKTLQGEMQGDQLQCK